VRLRPLSEAECYARCYGERSDEIVSVVSVQRQQEPPPQPQRNELREFLASWLDRAAPPSEPAA